MTMIFQIILKESKDQNIKKIKNQKSKIKSKKIKRNIKRKTDLLIIIFK
jgi:hypothetical protein